MPQILHTDGGLDAGQATDEQFVELLCADEDLWRAEFDAIIAAEWPGPPQARPERDASAERRPSPGPQGSVARVAGRPSQPRHPAGWTRQRSPPGPRQPQPIRSKGR